jgi:hypothetical protein
MGLREGGRARTRKLDADGTRRHPRVNTLGVNTHSFFIFKNQQNKHMLALFSRIYSRMVLNSILESKTHTPAAKIIRVTPSEVQPIFPGRAHPAGGGDREIDIASALEGRGLEASYAQRLWARSTTSVKKGRKKNTFFF